MRYVLYALPLFVLLLACWLVARLLVGALVAVLRVLEMALEYWEARK